MCTQNLNSVGEQFMQSVCEVGWQISSVHPENRAGDEATVSVRCAVCTEVSVQRSGECSVLVMFFSFSPLMYRLKVCLEPLYMLRSCVACMETTAMLTGTTTGQRANECLKQKKTLGRKEGGWEWERGKNVSVHCGGWTPLFISQ